MIKRALLLGACLLALAVGISACGGGSDTTGSEATGGMTGDEGGGAATGNIVAVAKETPDLSTLVQALTAADLVKTLEEPGPYTVFAPTNEAFAALGGKLDELLEPQNKKELAEILTYHVAPGEVASGQLEDGQRIKTVQGEDVEIGIEGKEVTVNGATVVVPDVAASNGIVHVIDEVLIPPAK
ncbi:MAG TPA: fasciclin domain-containing protein [Solirubrobacterales bacterium]|nr:fasciclin domain-containing protein [Solirubrobacterales bacterium]